ncbi:hypothetical protein Bpfe_030274, partial [Biomphalaria pfeifferi]
NRKNPVTVTVKGCGVRDGEKELDSRVHSIGMRSLMLALTDTYITGRLVIWAFGPMPVGERVCIIHILEDDSPIIHILEEDSPVIHILEEDSPVIHILEEDSPVIHILEEDSPVIHILEEDSPVIHILEEDSPVIHILEEDSPVIHILEEDSPVIHILEEDSPLTPFFSNFSCQKDRISSVYRTS